MNVEKEPVILANDSETSLLVNDEDLIEYVKQYFDGFAFSQAVQGEGSNKE
jgi:hypothetical protein